MYHSTELENCLRADLPTDASILTSDLNVRSARKLWLSQSLLKKFQDDINPDADAKCLEKFLLCNEGCKHYNLRSEVLYSDIVLGEMKVLLYNMFVRNGTDLLPSLSRFSEEWGIGPGANIDCESYDFYTKLFNSKLSRTSDLLYRLYRYAIVDDPAWISAELARSAAVGDSTVDGSRLTFVPKTREISRTVCTEPTLNMMFQKWVGRCLEDQLRREFRIDLSMQPELNRELARLGSIDGSFGTIDLSSASDSISLNLCSEILPVHLNDWLVRTRSPIVTLPSGEKIKLEMISSMGNGYTFPLQTLIFATLVVSCYRVLGIKPAYGSRGPANFAVFGDDIIVRSDAYEFVTSCLRMLGFTVNDGKSFNAGNFRESCGGDFYHGQNIRGVYIKSLKCDSLVYSAINRLLRWSSRDGELLLNTVSYLSSGLNRRKMITIPYCDGDSEGLKVPRVAAIGTEWCKSTYSVKYRALVRRTKSFRLPESDDSGKMPECRLPGFRYNVHGLTRSFIGGYIRHGRVTVRDDRFQTKVRWRYTSSWDYIPAADRLTHDQDYGWETMVILHLSVMDLVA